jgi:hypothetical protein
LGSTAQKRAAEEEEIRCLAPTENSTFCRQQTILLSVAMSDRKPPEPMTKMTRGRETLRRVQKRNTLSEGEAIELGVRAVHEARRKRRAGRLRLGHM